MPDLCDTIICRVWNVSSYLPEEQLMCTYMSSGRQQRASSAVKGRVPFIKKNYFLNTDLHNS